jgi:hypothetical protein
MIAEQQLKSGCTPEIIKRMVELAEGFEFYENEEGDKYYSHKESKWIPILIFNPVVSPLLIHRAVEGWNKVNDGKISIHDNYVEYQKDRIQVLQSYMEMLYEFDEYFPSSLTPCECACLHCLIEVLK